MGATAGYSSMVKLPRLVATMAEVTPALIAVACAEVGAAETGQVIPVVSDGVGDAAVEQPTSRRARVATAFIGPVRPAWSRRGVGRRRPASCRRTRTCRGRT